MRPSDLVRTNGHPLAIFGLALMLQLTQIEQTIPKMAKSLDCWTATHRRR
jgi:hypothetical protein